MDPWIIVGFAVLVVPVAVIWALAKSAALRGPEPRPGGGRPVESLVTEVIPDDHPEEDDFPDNADPETRPGTRDRPTPPRRPPYV